jgi:hypothetical protein
MEYEHWRKHFYIIKVKQFHSTPMEAQGRRGSIAPTHS